MLSQQEGKLADQHRADMRAMENKLKDEETKSLRLATQLENALADVERLKAELRDAYAQTDELRAKLVRVSGVLLVCDPLFTEG